MFVASSIIFNISPVVVLDEPISLQRQSDIPAKYFLQLMFWDELPKVCDKERGAGGRRVRRVAMMRRVAR